MTFERRRRDPEEDRSSRSGRERAGKTGRKVLWLCAFLSGGTGLVYEVTWARQAALFLGTTAAAHTATICAFLLGLALGNLVLGPRADRSSRPLRLYAGLEAGIGLFAAATPWLFPYVQDLYAAVAGGLAGAGAAAHVLRFAMASLVMLVPSFLMGGTLPALACAVRDEDPFASTVGKIYGINTVGAAAGAFAAGYLMLPALGIRRTILLAAGLNLVLAATLIAVDRWRVRQRSAGVAAPVAAPPYEGSRAQGWILMAGFGVSGFAALVLEVAWIRALILVIGSSVYAFSATLATYLLGLGLGSLVEARIFRRPVGFHRRLAWAGGLELAVGCSTLLGLALITQLPRAFLIGYRAGLHESFLIFQGFTFGLCFWIMFVPTLLLGILFPLLTSLWPRRGEGDGGTLGKASAINTAGTILGALLGGLLMLSTLGIRSTVLLAAVTHAAVGLLLWLAASTRLRLRLRAGTALAGAAAFLLFAGLVPSWDRLMMTSGPLFHAEKMLEDMRQESLEQVVRHQRLLYYAEGMDATVSVVDTGAQRLLVLNGKTDASSSGDLATQVLLGQLPMLVHRQPKSVLVIGLGSGITAGSVVTHPVERLEVVEISPEVVAASEWFIPENGDVLRDPRVQLTEADARNSLLASDRQFDVIVSEPSNPWISGVSNLFTREFFELARRRLAAGGVMAQWFQVYQLPVEDFKTLLRTYREVFPYVSVWLPQAGDLLVLGSDQAHGLSYERVLDCLEKPRIRADLERIAKAAPARLVELLLLPNEQLESYTAGAPLNTDDAPRIEFHAPRAIFLNATGEIMTDLIRHLKAPVTAPVSDLAHLEGERLVAPALGIQATTSGRQPGLDWTAEWMLSWRPGPSRAGALVIEVDSQQVLAWRQEGVSTRITASSLSRAPDLRQLGDHLRSIFPVSEREHGEIHLQDGVRGAWVLGLGPEDQLYLAAAWLCPGREDRSYLAFRELPDPGADQWAPAVLDLGRRLGCLPARDPARDLEQAKLLPSPDVLYDE